jgi:hypothetical protein
VVPIPIEPLEVVVIMVPPVPTFNNAVVVTPETFKLVKFRLVIVPTPALIFPLNAVAVTTPVTKTSP